MSNKFIISGGGTGGHIFPAIAIANGIKKREPSAEILFIGAKGRMEMKRVPNAGYDIVGLPVAGFQRKVNLKNIYRNTIFPFKLLWSMIKAYKVIRKFKPNAVIGVGGYASGPTLKMAAMMKIPTILQEQNSFPGATNRMLAKKADKICVAYEETDKYFSKEKMVLTGNPIREDLLQTEMKNPKAYEYFKLNPNKKCVAVIGGSLGAKTLNISLGASLEKFELADVQLIWQTGERYYKEFDLASKASGNIKIMPFVDRMDYLYSVADLVVSRAGALSISELACLGKPTILVPSPNVSGDHQTKNAKVLADKDAAIMLKDSDAIHLLPNLMIDTLNDTKKLENLSENILKFAHKDALNDIVNVIFETKK